MKVLQLRCPPASNVGWDATNVSRMKVHVHVRRIGHVSSLDQLDGPVERRLHGLEVQSVETREFLEDLCHGLLKGLCVDDEPTDPRLEPIFGHVLPLKHSDVLGLGSENVKHAIFPGEELLLQTLFMEPPIC